MIIIKDIKAWTKIRKKLLNTNIGFVPTMGSLHEGHKSLIKKSIEENQVSVISIFINPTQFDNRSDFEKYPSSFEDDVRLLEQLKVDYLFAPTFEMMYPDNYNYKLKENKLSNKLCGSSRPGHFNGVLTVVMKLLNIVKPTRAYFGEKDYQQYLLVKGMTEAFFLDMEIIPCATVRNENGLALSSRNMRLTPEEKELAAHFPKLLNSNRELEEIARELTDLGFRVDYIEEYAVRRFGAVFLGEVRLIDNFKIAEKGK